MSQPLARHTLVTLALIALLALPAASTARSERPAAAEGQCPQIVQNALAQTEQLCDGTGRNQACYGHSTLEAEPQPDVDDFAFATEGDHAKVSDVRSLRLSQMDQNAGTWGVALLRLQASLPDREPTNVTIVLFGDVAIQNETHVIPEVAVTTANPQGVNMRRLPDDSSEDTIIGRLMPGEMAYATGQLEDGAWLRVRNADTGKSGWIAAWLLTVEGDLSTVDVVAPGATYYGPMQAFTFQSGRDDAQCAEAPQSGMMIQTPEGGAKVTFLINEIDIQLGSTVYFQAQPAGEMTVRVVEGSARVTTPFGAQIARAGTELSVPLGPDLKPNGPPSAPRAYGLDTVSALPLGVLPRAVEVAPPFVASSEEDTGSGDTVGDTGDTGDSGDTGDTGDTGTASDLPPGLVDNPGLDGELPPGQGGDAPPGQTKKK